jgi:hypothetical protein
LTVYYGRRADSPDQITADPRQAIHATHLIRGDHPWTHRAVHSLGITPQHR